MIKRTAICILLILLPLIFVTQAQDSGQPFAAVNNGILTLYGVSANPLTITNPTNRGLTSLIWSPDGTKLAYLLESQDFQLQLMVVASGGGTPVQLDAGEMEAGFPISFTNDGNILYIGRGVLPGPDNNVYRTDVKQIAPEAGAKPETLNSFTYGVGCGGGSPLPGDWRYWEETGFGGNYLTLQTTDFGLLHSTRCDGVGLALLNLATGVDTPIGPVAPQQGHLEGYSRAVLSPDGRQLAALYTSYAEPTPQRALTIIDLKTLNTTPVTTIDLPDQIAWGRDGSLFFSTTTFDTNLVDALTADEKQALSQTNTMDIPGQKVAIHQIFPADGNGKVIYQASGYAIGRMALSSDGQSLIFSQVANMDAWIKAIADGTLDVVQDSGGVAQRALVPVLLFKLPLNVEGAPTRLGDNLSQFTLQPAAID